MLKRLICISLIFLLVSSPLTRLFYFAGYQLNKTYIASELCINKNKPELHCNGKCFLAKKIAEAAKKQQSNERKTQKDLSQQSMLMASFKISFFENTLKTEFTTCAEQRPINSCFSISHPPPMA
nr:hypothetical protein [uncultured Pedobacter sp.]